MQPALYGSNRTPGHRPSPQVPECHERITDFATVTVSCCSYEPCHELRGQRRSADEESSEETEMLARVDDLASRRIEYCDAADLPTRASSDMVNGDITQMQGAVPMLCRPDAVV